MKNIDNTQEAHWTVAGCAGSYLGHPSKMRLATDCTTLTCMEGDGKKCCGPKSVAPAQPCTQKAEGQNPPLRTVTVPPTGERLGSFPSMDPRVNLVEQISQIEMNSLDSRFPHVDLQNDISTKSLYVMTNRQEEPDMNKDLELFEAVPGRNELLEKSIEREEEDFPTQSFSPIRKIRRKLRVYRRQKPKVDTNLGPVKLKDVPDNSIQKLWELFQSSDDMNVEFHGFQD